MSAQVQFMITSAMRLILTEELGFEHQEVDEMRPEIAAQLIETRTKRPFGDRPMPEAWKRGGPSPGGGGRRGNSLVRLFLLGLVSLGVALATGKLTPGQLLGGQEFGRQKLTKLSDEMKPRPKKKKKKSTKKRTVKRKKKVAAKASGEEAA